MLIFGVNKRSEDSNEATKQLESIFSKIGIALSVFAHSRRFRQKDVSKPAPIIVLKGGFAFGILQETSCLKLTKSPQKGPTESPQVVLIRIPKKIILRILNLF